MENKTLKILYIEDDLGSRTLVKKILERFGHKIIEAEDGIEGIKKAKEETPDIILMDINIPGMDGYETTTKLKSITTLANVPIIAVTADVMKGDREMAITAGCDGYIQKPIDPYKFYEQIEEFITGKKEIVEKKVEVELLKKYSEKLVNRLEDKIRELTKINTELEQKVKERTEDLEKANEKLEQLAITDELTGLYNRRYFDRQLDMEFLRCKRFDHNMSLIIFDIDDFKKFNDKYGHIGGDSILNKISKIIKDNIREVDFLIRFGGEELALILPFTDSITVKKIAERLRVLVENTNYTIDGVKENIRITISAGFSNYATDEIENKEDLIKKADEALYYAKKTGKNKICGWKDIR